MRNFFKTIMVVAVVAIASKASAQSGQLVFREGNNGTQNIVVNITDAPGQAYNLQAKTPVNVGDNDEARSLVLTNVRVGAVISVYDSPAGDASDDYCVITVKSTPAGSFIIPSFEVSFEDQRVKVVNHHKNGLDGKISFIRVN
jgi:hypothetical protein